MITVMKKSEPSFYDGYGFFAEIASIHGAWKVQGADGIVFLIGEDQVPRYYPDKDIRDSVFQGFLLTKGLVFHDSFVEK